MNLGGQPGGLAFSSLHCRGLCHRCYDRLSDRVRRVRTVIERNDREVISENLAEEFILLSPATSRPFIGRALGSGLVHAARTVL